MAQSDRPFTSPKANLGAYPSFTSTYHHKSYDAISPLNPHLSLQGKNVLITGGGSGIGRATVVAFAQAGASNVIITGRNGSKLEETRKAVTEAMSKEQNKSSNAQIHTFAADITDMAGMTKVFKTVAETIGAIDILINSAGYLAKPSGTIDMDIDENWLGVEINVKGTMIMVQTYLKHVAAMKIQDPIYINVSSGAAHVTFPSSGVYGAGKAAATRIMDYAQLNHPELRVFNLQPGIVKTPMSKKSNLQIPEEMWDDGKFLSLFGVGDPDTLVTDKDTIQNHSPPTSWCGFPAPKLSSSRAALCSPIGMLRK